MPAQLKPGLYGPGWLSPEDAGSGCGNGKPGRPHHLLREQFEGRSCRLWPIATKSARCLNVGSQG